jgi:UDP-N-acetylmuramoylalanine--D-glutamate ligase
VDKNSDFTPLVDIAERSLKALLLFGIDADKIAVALIGSKPQLCADLQDAVRQAQALAKPGDIVLLAPACASFDMFENYIARGNAFVKCVQALEVNDAIIN